MSVNIPNHFVEQFTTNVAHLLQIQGGKLRGKVNEATHHGEGAVAVDQFGQADALEVVSRFQPMPRVDVAVDRRWVHPHDVEIPQMVDTFDKLRLMIDPQGMLAQSAVKGMARHLDETIFSAFFGDAATGKSGGTTESFDTTNYTVAADVGDSSDTGLNVDKILRAKRLMQGANVDFEMDGRPMMAISPEQEEDLLRQVQVTSSDFFTKGGAPIYNDGKITSWCGVDIIVSNLVPTNASYRLVPMWVKNGMHLGVWKDVNARVDERADISGVPMQLYSCMTIGTTRLEQGRVVQIECTEA